MTPIEIGPFTKSPQAKLINGPRHGRPWPDKGFYRMRGIHWSDPVGEVEGQTVSLNGRNWRMAVVGFQEGRGYAGVHGHQEPKQAELVFPLTGVGRMQISSEGSFGPDTTTTHALIGPLKPEQVAAASLTLSIKNSGPDGKVSEQLILNVVSSGRTWEIPPVTTPIGAFHRTVIAPNFPLTYFVVKLEPVS